MTKEELLQTYLKDDIFTENDYLDEGESENFDWNDKRRIPIVELLKIVIKGQSDDKGERTVIRLANQFLDNKL
ncbi:MAG: hypothetical protein JXR11_07375 [Balneola sp.]